MLESLIDEAEIRISSGCKTPFFLTDLAIVKDKYHQIQLAFPNFDVFYAVKANTESAILEKLIKASAKFEVTSFNEYALLERLEATPDRITCLNPIKAKEMIAALYQKGIRMFAVDSRSELAKFREIAPEALLFLRVVVENEGSDWPLTKKFGVHSDEAIKLAEAAREMGLNIGGITTHVGSQCYSLSNWRNGVLTCSILWNALLELGYDMRFFSLGGGLPIRHTKSIPDLKDIGRAVADVIKHSFRTQPICSIEPGRGVVGDSTILASSVIGTAIRGSTNWAYLDTGVFHGLMETIEGFKYEVITKAPGASDGKWTLAGPSCDSVDIIMENVKLPTSLDVGDHIFICNAGAYTNVYSTNFNGFESPYTMYTN